MTSSTTLHPGSWSLGDGILVEGNVYVFDPEFSPFQGSDFNMSILHCLVPKYREIPAEISVVSCGFFVRFYLGWVRNIHQTPFPRSVLLTSDDNET